MSAVSVLLTMLTLSPPGPDDGGAPSGPAKPRSPVPSDAQCLALGPVMKPPPFSPGELLEYDIDALGAKAGSMVMRVLPPRPDGHLTIEISVETNAFFSKVRRVKGTGTSTLDPKTLRPLHYLEDSRENDLHRVADVTFLKGHVAKLTSTIQGETTSVELKWGNDIADLTGALFLLRSLPLRAGQSLCFDVYAIRRIWRVWGKVLPREHVSLPLGEFEAWHLAGDAARLDSPDQRREIHVWVSDDARRLPLGALGSIDLGAVRATLKAFERRGEKGNRADRRDAVSW